MVLERTSYPQVDPRAEGLMTTAVARVRAATSIEDAARRARNCRVGLVIARGRAGWRVADTATLRRAVGLGIGRAPVSTVLCRAPAILPSTPETRVRRRLGPAAPFLVVGRGGVVAGIISRDTVRPRALPRAVGDRLSELPSATRDLLRTGARLGMAHGWAVAIVGGFVRDLLRGAPGARGADLDLAVEGDGPELARRLAEVRGGTLRRHDRFLTATVTFADGRRIDVATARREHYRSAGALPEVEPASLVDDLTRRDFSVNAMAVRLDEQGGGQLLDPTGGVDDLERRRIRVLHALSFVEDPTRMFRAVRFAARLGFHLEPGTRELLVAASRVAAYPALSGERLWAELEALLAEPTASLSLVQLGRLGVFRLLLGGYRFRASAAARLRSVTRRQAALAIQEDTVRTLYLLALVDHLVPARVAELLGRLRVPARLGAAVQRARRAAPAVARALGSTRRADAAFARLHGVPEATAAWTYVRSGSPRARRHLERHLARWRHLRPFLDGDALAALGVPRGPAVGRARIRLLALQAAGRLRSARDATRWVRAVVRRRNGAAGPGNGLGADRAQRHAEVS